MRCYHGNRKPIQNQVEKRGRGWPTSVNLPAPRKMASWTTPAGRGSRLERGREKGGGGRLLVTPSYSADVEELQEYPPFGGLVFLFIFLSFFCSLWVSKEPPDGSRLCEVLSCWDHCSVWLSITVFFFLSYFFFFFFTFQQSDGWWVVLSGGLDGEWKHSPTYRIFCGAGRPVELTIAYGTVTG